MIIQSNHWTHLAMSLVALPLMAGEPLTFREAVQRAWRDQAALQAGEAMVEKGRAEADAMRALRMPSLSASAGFTRTNEPMLAFGTKLDQARIASSDFNPSSLNHPDPVTGFGAQITLSQPLYAGGRIAAATRAGEAMDRAEVAAQAQRRQQVALEVARAYFGAQVAQQGVRFAEDTLKQAQETERFVQARMDQGLMLKSEAERAKAFRAQAEAGLIEARRLEASARSGLALLMGVEGGEENLITALPDAVSEEAPETGSDPSPTPGSRSDLEVMRNQVRASEAGVEAAKGTGKPEVGLQLTAGTARSAWNQGGSWTTASLGAKWQFSFSDASRVKSARAQARAAQLQLKWQEAVAVREVAEARRALVAASSRIASARVAVEASESVRTLRTARHREGLLPLVEVLEAESALTGARTLLLNSQLEYRIGKAQLALVSGQPIEGIEVNR